MGNLNDNIKNNNDEKENDNVKNIKNNNDDTNNNLRRVHRIFQITRVIGVIILSETCISNTNNNNNHDNNNNQFHNNNNDHDNNNNLRRVVVRVFITITVSVGLLTEAGAIIHKNDHKCC